MKNVLCCFLLLVLGFVACFHLSFVAFCCSSLLFLVFEMESILSQTPKQANAFCCSLWLFVARFGFLWMFPFERPIARCGFLLVRKTKTSNKRQKKSKWKPGFSELPNGNSNCNVFQCSVLFVLFARFLVRLTVAKLYYRLLKKPLAFTNCSFLKRGISRVYRRSFESGKSLGEKFIFLQLPWDNQNFQEFQTFVVC